MLEFAALWFDDRTVQGVFQPLVADWQREWHDASPGRRRWIWIRGMLALITTTFAASPMMMGTRLPASVAQRVAARIAAIVAAGSTLLLIPYIIEMAMPSGRWWLTLLIMPSTMAAAFPFAMIAAVDAIRDTGMVAVRVQRVAALKLALLSMALMVFYGGWVVPAANQVWRRAAAPPFAAAVPGLREITTWELLTDSSRAQANESGALGDRAARVSRELQNRLSLSMLPAVLIWLRFRAFDAPARRWIRRTPVAIATVAAFTAFMACFFSGFWLEFQHGLWPGSGFWLAIATLVLWGAATPALGRVNWVDATIRGAQMVRTAGRSRVDKEP